MAVHAEANPPVWHSEGVVTNPNGTSNFAVDTGAQAAGIYECLLIVGGVPATAWTVQRRNAANGANVGDTITIYTPADSTAQYVFEVELETSERIRVLPSAETGAVCGTLILQKLL
jgi:hypothetical protein